MKAIYYLFTLYCVLFSFSLFAQSDVYVNDKMVSLEDLAILEKHYQLKFQAGKYWYDPYSGWWGQKGTGPLGIILPAMRLGGSLKADASGGKTGIYFNERELTKQEAAILEKVVTPMLRPGHYWLDSYGNVGIAYGPGLFNLYQAYQKAPQHVLKGDFFKNTYSDFYEIPQRSTLYVVGKPIFASSN